MTPRQLFAAAHFAEGRRRRAEQARLNLVSVAVNGDGKAFKKLFGEIGRGEA